MRELKPGEVALLGRWVKVGDQILPDATAERIIELVSTVLTKVAVDASGWDVLYQDPSDGRYWELTYPESWQHGGGPPALTMLPSEEVARKYRLHEDADGSFKSRSRGGQPG